MCGQGFVYYLEMVLATGSLSRSGQFVERIEIKMELVSMYFVAIKSSHMELELFPEAYITSSAFCRKTMLHSRLFKIS